MNDKTTDTQHRLRLQKKIRRTERKVVAALERIVDRLIPEPPPPARSRTAERRQVANVIGASQFCARSACRRAHAAWASRRNACASRCLCSMPAASPACCRAASAAGIPQTKRPTRHEPD